MSRALAVTAFSALALLGCPPGGTADIGNICANNSDCRSGKCFASHCTKDCTSPSDCPPPPEYQCQKQAGQGQLCICTPNTIQGREICDGRDNDCDGFVDNNALCGPGMTCDKAQC